MNHCCDKCTKDTWLPVPDVCTNPSCECHTSKGEKGDVAVVREIHAKMPWWFNLEKFLDEAGLSTSDINVVFGFINEGEKWILKDLLTQLPGERPENTVTVEPGIKMTFTTTQQENSSFHYNEALRTITSLIKSKIEQLQ